MYTKGIFNAGLKKEMVFIFIKGQILNIWVLLDSMNLRDMASFFMVMEINMKEKLKMVIDMEEEPTHICFLYIISLFK